MHTPFRHRATYDAFGNIILSEESSLKQEYPRPTGTASLPFPSFAEGFRQYRWTMGRLLCMLQSGMQSLRLFGQKTMAFLAQPVWIPGRKGIPRQYSRGALFLLDSLRFGATFALIFGVLFLTLNYQSFGKIAVAMTDPLASLQDRLPVEQAAEMLSQKTPHSGDSDPAQFLPQIGPPNNRLLIPSLGLNVPIVIPPNDALIAEDWGRLESDIQTALEHGTIHYPGTASPGHAGNFFITGHSSYYPWATGKYKSVFARLPMLKIGDEFWIYYGGDRHRYIIQEKKEVRPTDVGVLDQPLDRRIATLMTCVPVGTTLRRLIVTAQELDPITGTPMAVGQHTAPTHAPKAPSGMLPI